MTSEEFIRRLKEYTKFKDEAVARALEDYKAELAGKVRARVGGIKNGIHDCSVSGGYRRNGQAEAFEEVLTMIEGEKNDNAKQTTT